MFSTQSLLDCLLDLEFGSTPKAVLAPNADRWDTTSFDHQIARAVLPAGFGDSLGP
jgi:hypothetical protein